MSTGRLPRNSIASVAQVVLSTLLLLILYRVLVRTIGAEGVGIWSLVLAGTAISRLAEFGFTGAVVKFVAGGLAGGDREGAASDVWLAASVVAGFLGVGMVVVLVCFDLLIELAVDQPAARESARALLPFAIASLWLSGIGAVVLSGIDGCQRMDLRSLIVTLGTAANVGIALMVVGTWGLRGVAIAHLTQSILVLAVAAVVLARLLPLVRVRRRWWSRRRFRAFFKYGINIQIASMAMLLFEPTTKMLLGRYGDLAAVGYYEMANGVITRARALLVAAYQALVPTVAGMAAQDSRAVVSLYQRSLALLMLLIPPGYASLAISVPALSIVLLGQRDMQFLVIAWMACAGWVVNTINVPAYFCNVGTGHLRWNTISHVVMGVANLGLSATLGAFFGWHGVIVGSMTALSLGSLPIVVAFHRQHRLSLGEIVPHGHRLLLATSVIAATALTTASNYWLPAIGDTREALLRALVPVAAGLLLLGALVLRHPLFHVSLTLLRRAVSPRNPS
ncbi:MAG: oligosaccharide flippase family protein [Defluviicoccus sp.]|nr:oligosaccharide flippase family protein [Defluviicoccus sp.]MDG4594060.1 oligosaccharide flippase family protein [Defluviicoccus sp.]